MNTVISTEDEYKTSEPYRAYVEKTNEKVLLHKYIEDAFLNGEFPIKKNDGSGLILDAGSGNGVNSFFLAKLFDKSIIDGVEPSEAQFNLALKRKKQDNINFINVGLEKFETEKKYDFILVSHVLQYIPVSVESFVNKVANLLKENGEAWFIQQTKEGINQIIQHQKELINNPRFESWMTFEDYLPIIKEIIGNRPGYGVETDYIQSSFENINFKNPTENDKLRLEFILLLDKPYDQQSDEFKNHLAKLNLNHEGKIKHPNGVLKLKKL